MVVGLLKFIGDKDIFLKQHQYKLARRLLQHRSQEVIGREAALVSLFKKEFGSSEIVELEKMLADMEESLSLQAAFQAKCGVNSELLVLTESSWTNLLWL
jgi:hypothetical protein